MAISSAGVGSGLNVQSIISQLVAVESRPVQLLQQKGSVLQTKISAFGQVKSDLSSLQDAASALMNASTWSSKTFASDNTSIVTGTAGSTALASTFSLTVTQLAKGQSSKSGVFASDYKAPTAGTLSIQLGTWGTGNSFSNAASSAVSITVAKDDSLATIAANINAKSSTAGVSATVVTANGTQQLLLRGTNTGAAAGFQINASSGLDVFGTQQKQPFVAPADTTLSLQLDTNAFPTTPAMSIAVTKGESLDAIVAKINENPPATGIVASKVTASDGTQQLQLVDGTQAPVTFGMTDTATSAAYPFTQINGSITRNQLAQDASITIDTVSVTSASNTVSNALPGVTLNLLATTTATPIQVTVGEDKEAMKAKIQAFQEAYNKLNTDQKSLTKYDATSKTGGPLLGDSTVTGIQSMLRSILVAEVPNSVSSISSLSKFGISVQADGSIKTDITKVDSALQNTTNVKAFFSNNSKDAKEKGIARRFYDFVFAANAVDGAVSGHSAGFQKQVERNNKTIDKMNAHLADYQKQLAAQYTALDNNMAKLSSLSSYVSQQITSWNKSS